MIFYKIKKEEEKFNKSSFTKKMYSKHECFLYYEEMLFEIIILSIKGEHRGNDTRIKVLCETRDRQ